MTTPRSPAALADEIRRLDALGLDWSDELDRLATLATTAQAAEVPAGFVLVPVEPTPDMRSACRLARAANKGSDDVWTSMLAARPDAPPAPAAEVRVPLTDERIHALSRDCYDGRTNPLILFARAVERAHGITQPSTTEPGAG